MMEPHCQKLIMWLLLRIRQFQPLSLQDVLCIILNLIAFLWLSYAVQEGEYVPDRICIPI